MNPAPTVATIVLARYTVLENGYLHRRVDSQGAATFRAFYCVPVDCMAGGGGAEPSPLAALLPTPQSTRVFVGSFQTKRLGCVTWYPSLPLPSSFFIVQRVRSLVTSPCLR